MSAALEVLDECVVCSHRYRDHTHPPRGIDAECAMCIATDRQHPFSSHYFEPVRVETRP